MRAIADALRRAWERFADKYPRLSKWVYQIFFFVAFSIGVTVFQYLVFTFMPA